jgi:hypothetical protein
MAFYVPLGPRGLILRIGTTIIGVMGLFIYWRQSRRRALVPLPMPAPIVLILES